jgi:amino acid transporter/nucleotide-binding universal stress UspA family protein
MHRPRNVGWKRAAGLLYGDWGTSKAYVIGVAFSGMATMAGAAGYSALPSIVAVCVLTALVAYNYVIICRHFPDGGGVYSAARLQSRFLAVLGALLLVADMTVTAAMSCWNGMSYFRVPDLYIKFATIGAILLIGGVNYFGPKHSGSFALFLAVPMVLVVLMIVGLSVFSHQGLTTRYLLPPETSFSGKWLAFTSMILALSGVEAVANLTGVLRLDPGATMELPQVRKTASKAIWVVALEVCVGTALLGWAMLSIPSTLKNEKMLHDRWEDMLSVLAQWYGTDVLGAVGGKAFAIVTALVVGLLLLSAVNTAIAALIGLLYMVGRDGEMPRSFTRLNSHGVPWVPLAVAVGLPILVVIFNSDLSSLMGLYAIGVVGAITVNLGSCTFNKSLGLNWHERLVMGFTFAILLCVELTIAKHKPDALFFVVCVLGGGLGLRAYAQRRAGLRTVTVSQEVAAAVEPTAVPAFRLDLNQSQNILVAARGLTPVLRYALEEARFRKGALYVLYVKELAVTLPGPLSQPDRPRWQEDKAASEIMVNMLELGRQSGVTVVPVYAVSESPATTILDLAATLGVDILMLGAPHRRTLVSLLKGNVVNEVAGHLPESIQLVIYG